MGQHSSKIGRRPSKYPGPLMLEEPQSPALLSSSPSTPQTGVLGLGRPGRVGGGQAAVRRPPSTGCRPPAALHLCVVKHAARHGLKKNLRQYTPRLLARHSSGTLNWLHDRRQICWLAHDDLCRFLPMVTLRFSYFYPSLSRVQVGVNTQVRPSVAAQFCLQSTNQARNAGWLKPKQKQLKCGQPIVF